MKKKVFLWGIAIFAIFGLIGCPGPNDDPPPSPPAGPVTPAGWTTGLTDFTVTTGENPGELKYSFSATSPAADTYTLYYAEGRINTASGIKTASTTNKGSEDAQPGDNVFAGIPGRTYSFVIEAGKSGIASPATSAVKIAATKAAPPVTGGKSLRITGIPSNVNIVAAVLFEDMDDELVTAAFNSNGTFAFLEFDGETGEPDWNKAWNGSGSFYIYLIDSMEMSGDSYVYTAGGEFPAGVKKFTIAEASSYTIAWNQFKKVVIPQVTLTITGVPAEAGIIGASLLDEGFNPLAAGMITNGVINFYVYTGEMPIPIDFTQPWTQTGEYFIALSDESMGTGDNYMYTKGGSAPVPYDIVPQNTIAWDQFSILGGGGGDDQIKLSITGDIPSTVNIVSLMKDGAPVAAGLVGTGGVVPFFTSGSGGMPDFGNPYTTIGSYGILAMEVDIITHETGKIYTYTANSGAYTFSSEQGTVAWADFTLTSGGEEEGKGFTLKVGTIPTEITIVAAALFTTPGPTPAYTALNSGGEFTFTTASSDDYFIMLLTGMTATDTRYTYVGSGQVPATYTFTEEQEHTIAWDQFKDLDEGGGTEPIEGVLEGSWSNEQDGAALKTFTFGADLSFEVSLNMGMQIDTTGKLTPGTNPGDYVMSELANPMASSFNGATVTITFTDADTFVLSGEGMVQTAMGGTYYRQQIQGDLEGSWSNEEDGTALKTFTFDADLSFEVSLNMGMPMTVTGTLTYDDGTKDYVMTGMTGGGASFNNSHVTITFTDEDTFVLSGEGMVQTAMGGTYYRQD